MTDDAATCTTLWGEGDEWGAKRLEVTLVPGLTRSGRCAAGREWDTRPSVGGMDGPDTSGVLSTVTANEGDPISSEPTATQPPSPTTPRKIRIYLLDDHEMVRRGHEGPARGRRTTSTVVGESGSGRGGRRPDPGAAARRGHPRRPPARRHRRRRLPAVRSVDPSHPALILTSYDDDEALFSAIMAGAAGYVLKQIVGGATSSRPCAGSPPGSRCSTRAVTQRCSTGSAQGHPGARRAAALTAQERLVLELIAEGLTNRQIGERHVPRREDRQELRRRTARQARACERRTQAAVFASKLLQSP